MNTTYRTSRTRFFAPVGAIALGLAVLLNSAPAFAGPKPVAAKPPTPTNFRVTAKTAYTVTVAWDAPTSSTGFNFHLSGAYGVTAVVLPATARSHTFTALAPGNQYWFFIYAKNSAGSVSGQANLGPVTLPRDTTPPWTAPVVKVGEVGANYAHLSWTRAQDDGPYHYSYELWLNGSFYYRSDYPRNTTNTVLRFLEPDTDYLVQIRTRDIGGNFSPLSAPVLVATPPVNPNDTQPPSVPGPVFADSFGDLEMSVWWGQSTDNFDAQANIRYDVYVNGRLEDIVFGSGGPRVVYGTGPGENLIEVFATDTSGNESAAGTFVKFL